MTSYIVFMLRLQSQPHVLTRALGCPRGSGELGTEVAAGGGSPGAAASAARLSPATGPRAAPAPRLLRLPPLRGLSTTAGRPPAMSVFVIDAFSICLSVIFYLSIREGDLSHSGVIAGNLEKRHKGEFIIRKPSLRDCPRGAASCALPQDGTLCPHPSPAGHGADAPECCCHQDPSLSKLFQTGVLGRWDPGLHSTGRVFGKGQKGPRVPSECCGPAQSRDPPAARTELGHHVPVTSLPQSPQHSSACQTGRSGGGCLVHQHFLSAMCPISGGKLHLSSLLYHQVKY